NCLIEVAFGPSSAGTHNDSIEIQYNNGVSTQVTARNVTGVGVAPATLVISESDPHNFGSVATGSTASYLFTVDNTGGFQATAMSEIGLSAPFGFTGGTYPGDAGTCAATLAALASCTIEVEFSPVSTGVASDTIQISYNNGASVVNAT